jgi:hypothetical protein
MLPPPFTRPGACSGSVVIMRARLYRPRALRCHQQAPSRGGGSRRS